MKINVDQVLNNFDGKPMKENREVGVDDKGKPILKLVDLTLRSVISTALMFTTQKEAQAGPDADARIRRFILAQDVHKNSVVALRSEDVTDLKQRINDRFQTQVVAASLLVLDPPDKVKKIRATEPEAVTSA